MRSGNAIFASGGTTVFEVMSGLAREHGAINLGQGFPDEPGPDSVIAVAVMALTEQSNQYPPMMGIPELRQAVAAHNRRFYSLEVDWRQEVLVTSGATEALAASILGLVSPGDEVVLIEPLYDSYLPIVRLAGGIPRLVRLEPPDWRLPRAALAGAFGPRTKLLILNSPMNPCGKVFQREELGFLAGLLARHDTVALCDEVYEHLVFDGAGHLPLMCLPEMRERCVRIGSAGKTFSMTGWKVGYVTAPPALLSPIAKAHQFLVFTTPPNLQHAVAAGLALDDTYFAGLAQRMQAKRDRLTQGLARLGFDPRPSAGTYFLNAGFAKLGHDADDVSFCRRLTIEAGVAAIPVSAFYAESGPRDHVRFCICKQDSVLDAAVERLERYFTRGHRLTASAGGD
ncbi:MAG: aminotransferase [Alphaproteobacteria bacterium]|nr:aminotransferase [Alphaproteobacteria bacterium]